MKPYILSFAVGLLVGLIYALCNVRSPAPPVIALVGLLAILVGEQIPPWVRRAMTAEQSAASMDHLVKAQPIDQLPEHNDAGNDRHE